MKSLRFWAYFCAFLSLVVSLAMIILWICGVWELKVVNLNTFVGVTVALLGLIVTLAIAWQIYNAIDMKSKIDDLNSLRLQFEEHKQSIELENHKTGMYLNYLFSLGAFDIGDMLNSFRFMICALKDQLQLEKQKNIVLFMERMELIVGKIAPNSKYESDFYDEIIKSNEKIQSLDNYGFIKERYVKIITEFMSKVKRVEA